MRSYDSTHIISDNRRMLGGEQLLTARGNHLRTVKVSLARQLKTDALRTTHGLA